MQPDGNNRLPETNRRAILDAAMAEFETHGPDKASMRAIAASAGLTTGAIYSIFGGKDDLYAALLSESLARLEAHVRERTAAARAPEARLRAAVKAFYDYYAARLFEIQLGMYSFSGMKHGGLGRARNAELNAALLATLDIIGAAIAEAAPALTPAAVEAERNAIFASLVGALTLAHTGRATSIGADAATILESHLDALIARLN